jgi:hypothetical protein
MPDAWDQFQDAPVATATGTDLLSRAKGDYPYLANSGLVAISGQGGGNRKLEYWPRGEPGNAQYRRPAGIPLDAVGVEIFDKNVSPKDILADYVSHEAVKSDPKLSTLYKEFAATVPDETMRKRYAYHRDNLGEKRDYETWKETSGMPEYFRGYTFDQWPDAQRFYSPQQLKKLDEIRQYVGVGQSEGGDPWAQFQDADAPTAQASRGAGPQASQSDPFAGDSLLSNEAMSQLAAGAQSTVTPSPEPSPFRGVQRYLGRVDEAVGRLNRAPGTSGVGTLEALGTMATGAIAAPILGTAESIAIGTDPDKSFARYTYQPRTESGKAQLGVMGALVSPLTESGADVALAPLFAGESRALAANPARIPPNARRPRVGPDPVPGEPAPMAGPGAAGEAVPAPAVQTGRKAGLAGVPKETVPTRAELAEAAKAAYKRADAAGVVVSENSLKALKTRVVSLSKKEGLDKDLHPDSSAALKRVVQAKGDLTLTELETLRKIAKDAQGSMKPADKRIAGMIVEELDDYIDNLSEADVVAGDATKAKALKEARGLYSRAKKSEVVEDLLQRAQDSSSQFSGSGLENAIRTQFRGLAKNKKQMRMFSAEEQAAIRRVANGGPMENAARFIGKFAPTGVVSGVLTGGAGAMIGGPLGAALPLAGLGGRAVATRMTLRNVRAADELMRRGPNALPKETRTRNALADF